MGRDHGKNTHSCVLLNFATIIPPIPSTTGVVLGPSGIADRPEKHEKIEKERKKYRYITLLPLSLPPKIP